MRTLILLAGISLGVMFADIANGSSNLGLLATVMFIVLAGGCVLYDAADDMK